jgi:hypothetical protein
VPCTRVDWLEKPFTGFDPFHAPQSSDLLAQPGSVRKLRLRRLREHELLVDPPERAIGPSTLRQRSYRSTKVDYAASDAANRVLGSRGEEFVVEYERFQLEKKGRPDLAERVQRISQMMGDGAGYDVLSFDERGTEKYIEVKTTNGSKKTPFIVTVNEVEFS